MIHAVHTIHTIHAITHPAVAPAELRRMVSDSIAKSSPPKVSRAVANSAGAAAAPPGYPNEAKVNTVTAQCGIVKYALTADPCLTRLLHLPYRRARTGANRCVQTDRQTDINSNCAPYMWFYGCRQTYQQHDITSKVGLRFHVPSCARHIQSRRIPIWVYY